MLLLPFVLLLPLISGQPFAPAPTSPDNQPVIVDYDPSQGGNAYYYYDNYPPSAFQPGSAPGFGSPGAGLQYPDYGNYYPDPAQGGGFVPTGGGLPIVDGGSQMTEMVDVLSQTSQNVGINGSIPEVGVGAVDPAGVGSSLNPARKPQDLGPPVLTIPPTPETRETPKPKQLCRWDNQPYEPASRLDHGSYWFECIDGKFVPKGCFSDLGLRLSFGQTYNVSNGYEMMCDQLKNGSIRIQPRACLHKGLRYMPGDTFQDDFYWYSCHMRDDSQISKDMMGCVDAKNNRIASNGIFKQGTNLFQCVRDPQTMGMSLEPVACLHKSQRYDIGQTMIDGLFWYTCKKRGLSFLAPELSGCFYGNRTLKVGDRYYRGGFVYQCQRKPDSSLGHVIVGCLETNAQTGEVMGEKNFGDKWSIGTPPYMFMAYCENNPGGSATQRLIYCIYSVFGKNETVIQPGCYRQVDPDLMVLCYSRGDGALGIDRAGPGELHKVVALNLASCA